MEKIFLKILIFVGTTLLLGACSAPKEGLTQEKSQIEQLQSAGGLISTPDSGTGTSTGSDVTLTLTLKTNSSTLRTETISLTPESQGFSLLTTSCPNINNTRTCTVRIKFSAAGKANGTYTGAVVVSDLSVPLSLVLNKLTTNDLSALKVGLDAVEDITALDFGTISATGSVTKVLIVKDVNKSIKENVTISSSSPDFNVLTTSCVTTALNSTAGCSVRLQFNGSAKVPGNFAGNLNISTRVIPMTGVIQSAPIFVGTPDVKMLVNNLEVTEQNFGTINLNEKKAVVIKIKNEGTAASISNYFSVSGSSAFYVTGSSCGSTIQAGGSCQFTLNFNGTNILSHQVATVNYGSTNIQAIGEILGNCPVSQHLEGVSCINNIQNEVINNGTRVRSYNLGSSSWGDWAYNCSPTYIPSPSTNSCVPEFIKPNAPIVTLEMSSDQNHLIATSTCRVDLFGVFFDLFYEPENLLPADQYSPPYFVDQTFLHEDLGLRPEAICVPTGINNMGLMTVSVEISNEMREETVSVHSMIKGALMWDNNRNSDFSEMVSLFIGCPNGEHKEGGICISNLQNEMIANGSRERTFDMDSRQWLAWSYSCDPDYAEHLDACVLDTYTAQFGTIVNNKTEPCTGIERAYAPMVSCTRDLDGTLDASLMNCSNQSAPFEDHSSPAGKSEKTSIANGSQIFSCLEGKTSLDESSISKIICDSGYVLDLENCVQYAQFLNQKSGFDGNVLDATQMKDGSGAVIYVGNFANYTDANGVVYPASRIAKINNDGSFDQQFATNVGTGADNSIYTVAISSTNSIFVGGLISSWNSVSNIGGIVKLNAQGERDLTFTANIGSGTTSLINVIEVDSSSNVFAGGIFSSFNGTNIGGIVKLSSNGVVNSTFLTNAGAGFFPNNVRSIKVDSSGNVFVGGGFSNYGSGSNNARYLTKLSTNGVIDSTFLSNTGGAAATSGFNSQINSISIYNGSIYVGGTFTSYKGVANSARRIAKLSSAGVLDTAFQTNSGGVSATAGFDSVVSSLTVNSAGIFVGGSFSLYKNIASKYIVKLSVDGNLISGFANSNPMFTSISFIKHVDSATNNLILGGGGTRYFKDSLGNGSSINGAIGITPNGVINNIFGGPESNGIILFSDSINYVVKDSLGNKYIGGNFTSYNGYPANGLIKLDKNNQVDVTFLNNVSIPGTGSVVGVNALAVDSDNNLYIGGTFTSWNGTLNKARYLAKVSSSGVLDTTFQTNSGGINSSASFDSIINSVAIDANNNVFVAGNFSTYKGLAAPKIAKLNSQGVLDSSFQSLMGSGFDSPVNSLTVDLNNLYIGGRFSTFNGGNYPKFLKMNTSGAIDLPFMNKMNLNSNVQSAMQFLSSRVNKVLIDSLKNVYILGWFGSNLSAITKLNSLGELDSNFASQFIGSGFNSDILTGGIDENDNVYIGGSFTALNGVANSTIYLSKLSGEGILDSNFQNNIDSKIKISIKSLLVDSLNINVGSQYVGEKLYHGIFSLRDDGTLNP